MAEKSSEKKVSDKTEKKVTPENKSPKKAEKKKVTKKSKKKSAGVTAKTKKDSRKKHLCKWKKKQIADKFKEYAALVTPVGYICLKCGRAASDAKYLCKPQKIEK